MLCNPNYVEHPSTAEDNKAECLDSYYTGCNNRSESHKASIKKPPGCSAPGAIGFWGYPLESGKREL